MNKTRSILAVTGLALALAGAAAAHDRGRLGGPGMGFGPEPAKIVERMSRHLDLNETQTVEIENIVTAAQPEIDALKARAREQRQAMRDLTPDSDDYSARLNDLAASGGQLLTEGLVLFGRVRAEVHEVLTPEQAAELQALMEKRAERVAERRARRGGRGR